MEDMIICDERPYETDNLAEEARDINAYVASTKLNIHKFTSADECVVAVKSGPKTDMAVTSVPDNGDTKVPETVRSENRDSDIMLVADASVSPVRYLTPKVRACSLLLRPYDLNTCRRTLKDFMADHYRRKNEDDGKSVTIDNYGEKLRIPVSQIYYVEVRGKKVFIRLRNSEYSEYTTLEKILEKLGDTFVRCHRSFAFNRIYFESVKISKNIIKLSHGITVPLSRSYKHEIREFMNGNK